MELLVFAFVSIVVAILGYSMNDRTVDGTEVSLCLTCVNAVITRGSRSEGKIACNYAGVLRSISFTVCECTAYCGAARASKVVRIEGFVREENEVYEEIAIL